MSKKTREKLKALFSKGRMPSQVDFGDLIDSGINPVDDGFNITRRDGLQISPTDANVLASVYPRRGEMINPKWRIELGANENHIHIKNNIEPSSSNTLADDHGQSVDSINPQAQEHTDQPQSPILSISGDRPRVGIDKAIPQFTLDVNGTVAAKSRIGVYKSGLVNADSRWHDIVTGLQGCHMFEVTAGVSGGPKQGRYALLNAVAMNCYNPNFRFVSWFSKRIKHQHAWYYSRWDRIKLRWHKDGFDSYKLQIRTIRDFKQDDTQYQIKYHITQLWLDHSMGYNVDDGED